MSKDFAADCPPEEIVQGKIMRAEDAVKALQEAAGLEGKDVDGMFGKKTAEALYNKFGDLTDPAVIAKQSPEMQAALEAFDEGVSGSKGYFKKPDECKLDEKGYSPEDLERIFGSPDNAPASLKAESPAAQKTPDGAFRINPEGLLESGNIGVDTTPKVLDFSIEPNELGAFGGEQMGPEIRTLKWSSNQPIGGHYVDMAPKQDLNAPSADMNPINVSSSGDPGKPTLSVVQKELPANISGLPELSQKSGLNASGGVIAAGINPAQWGGADGANPAFASSNWNLRDMFSQAAEKVADVVENAFSGNTPAPTAAAPQPNTYLQTGTNGLNM